MDPDSRRRDDAIAQAKDRSSNDEDGSMPPQPVTPMKSCDRLGRGHRGVADSCVVVPTLSTREPPARDPPHLCRGSLGRGVCWTPMDRGPGLTPAVTGAYIVHGSRSRTDARGPRTAGQLAPGYTDACPTPRA